MAAAANMECKAARRLSLECSAEIGIDGLDAAGGVIAFLD
jgi:hypothetical protein